MEKIVDREFVCETGEETGELFGVLAEFCAEVGFASDERGGGGEGQAVAIVVFGVTETEEKVADVARRFLVDDFDRRVGKGNDLHWSDRLVTLDESRVVF